MNNENFLKKHKNKFLVGAGFVFGGVCLYTIGYYKGAYDASFEIARLLNAAAVDKPDQLLKEFVDSEVATGLLPMHY